MASLGFVTSSLIALAVLMSVVIILAVIAGVWYEGWSPARWMIVLGLLLAPASELTAYLFAASMGVLWLSTVPLTTGIVAQIFGLRFMATLFGFVFLSHQVGSFLGVWLGGLLYDRTGSYDAMWWAGVCLGVFAAVVHLPINDSPLARLRIARAGS